MPLSTPVTEDTLHRFCPDAGAIGDGQAVLRKGAAVNPGTSADGSWLIADFKGSGKVPYLTSIDFIDPAAPMGRCSCPSRRFPCKHCAALMQMYLQSPDKFGTREPSDELQLKRDKYRAQVEKKGAVPAAPKKTNKSAQDKKVLMQKEGLDLLEKMLVDLVARGSWHEASRLESLERVARQLGDHDLKTPMYVVRRLIQVGQNSKTDDERNALGADLIGQLWATVQRGRTYLDGKLEEGDDQDAAEAVMEAILGKAWRLDELEAQGYGRENLTLRELAYERYDDLASQNRVEASDLIDLATGEIFQAISLRPFKQLKYTTEQPSFSGPVRVTKAVVYPGFLNRRIRWQDGMLSDLAAGDAPLAKVLEVARPSFKDALDAFKSQIKNPLAPREALVLVRAEQMGTAGGKFVIEDAAGTRIPMSDTPNAFGLEYSNVANLRRAAGMFLDKRPAVLLRLVLNVVSNTVSGIPLAAVSEQDHLRLGI